MKTVKHYIYSVDLEENILELEVFDRETIHQSIINHLSQEKFKDDQLEHQKDWDNPKDAKKYVGKEVLNVYENNPNIKETKPSRVFQAGNAYDSPTLYQSL